MDMARGPLPEQRAGGQGGPGHRRGGGRPRRVPRRDCRPWRARRARGNSPTQGGSASKRLAAMRRSSRAPAAASPSGRRSSAVAGEHELLQRGPLAERGRQAATRALSVRVSQRSAGGRASPGTSARALPRQPIWLERRAIAQHRRQPAEGVAGAEEAPAACGSAAEVRPAAPRSAVAAEVEQLEGIGEAEDLGAGNRSGRGRRGATPGYRRGRRGAAPPGYPRPPAARRSPARQPRHQPGDEHPERQIQQDEGRRLAAAEAQRRLATNHSSQSA